MMANRGVDRHNGSMNHFWVSFLIALPAAVVWCGIVVAVLMVLPKLGGPGRRVSQACTRAPWLDGVVAAFSWIPWVVGACLGGWGALLGTLAGELLGLYLWIAYHEWAHAEAHQGPRIVKTINRLVGRWRNHAALWVTLIAYPGFWLIRFMELLVYPLLVWLLKFPRYRHSDWVNVSRQKFEGLIGHDLIWCLYCDWMTGVYSLGGEMLRNVESFWCPIRFYDGKKCANCRIDFPDIDKGWTPADGTMADVEQNLLKHYADGQRTWFNHPARLTVKGKAVEE
jgi:hypothetical protein